MLKVYLRSSLSAYCSFIPCCSYVAIGLGLQVPVIHNTVGGLESTVRLDGAIAKVDHPTANVLEHRKLEVPVHIDCITREDVIQTSLGRGGGGGGGF